MLFINAQSATVSVILLSGLRSAIALSTSQGLFTVPDISQFLFEDISEEMKYNEPERQK